MVFVWLYLSFFLLLVGSFLLGWGGVFLGFFVGFVLCVVVFFFKIDMKQWYSSCLSPRDLSDLG